MKGLIFRSFLNYSEESFGLAFVENMLNETQTSSKGIYTNIGTYDHEELIQYISHVCKDKNMALEPLVENFGYYLFGSLVEAYPHLINNSTTA